MPKFVLMPTFLSEVTICLPSSHVVSMVSFVYILIVHKQKTLRGHENAQIPYYGAFTEKRNYIN